jgi:plasmid stabilization system protein ParE
MAYLVKIFPRAERDLARIYTRINADKSDAALKWYRGFRQAILSLEETAGPMSGDP